MTAVEVFAPGKLFVIGEYAVLHGGRALVAALDAGIRCRLDDASGSWRISAPDLGLDMTLAEARGDSRSSLLAEAVAAGVDKFHPRRPLDVTVAGNHPASRRKSGLGGSAASVVAILAAMASIGGEDIESEETRKRLFALALAVHRGHQGGRGSGADVAASVYGGWIDYALGENGARIARAALPAETCLSAVWSGVASDTARAIAAFDRTDPKLGSSLDRFWAAVEAQDREAILREIAAYGAALGELAERGGDEGARRIAELVDAARVAGVAAKGSGAVGGDCVIAVAFDPADLRMAEDRWQERRADPLGVSIDARGVRRGESDA